MGACSSEFDFKKRTDHQQANNQNKANAQTNGKCELCKKTLGPNESTSHYDLAHFAVIRSVPRQSGIEVSCLLCSFQTLSLEAHSRHFKARHGYMEKYHKNNSHGSETHEMIRVRVKQAQKSDFKFLKEGKEGGTAEKNGQQFQVIKHQREYSSIQFDHQKAEGDLVWRYIFGQNPKAQYYAIHSEPGNNQITSFGYIFLNP